MTLAITLRQALDQTVNLRPCPLPDTPRCVGAMERATQGLADGGEPYDAEQLVRVVNRFRDAAKRNALDGIGIRDWRDVVWGIWQQPEPLAENECFLAALFARLKSGSRLLCRRLLLAYLREFDAAGESFRKIGGVLRNAVSAWEWDWKTRQREFALFEPDRAPGLLAAHCLSTTAPLAECLEQAGISGSRRFGGMEEAAFRRALGTVRRALETNEAAASLLLARVLAWAMHEGQLAFPRSKAALAEALLLPWLTQTPPDDLQEQITGFLLRALKDPRIEPVNWYGVEEEAVRVIRRWLTRVALEQFLQVVDKVAKREQWRYRRAFWMAYYERGLIDEAWVVFAPAAERLGGWGLRELAGFGRLLHPRLNNHCVLLMRLAGDLTVAEMSHVGKCRIWLPARSAAPQLYRQSYRLRDIETSPDIGVVHQGSARFDWQDEIASFLASHAGLHVPESSFRPK